MGDSRNTRPVKMCHVCGDVGFLEKIVTCFQCKITQEHVYCMPVPLLRIPEIWICEICQSDEEETQQSFITPYNSGIVHNDSVQSLAAGKLPKNLRRLVHLQKETALGTREVKVFSGEEEIKLSSKVPELENCSSSGQGSTSGHSVPVITSANTAMTIGYETPFSTFTQQIAKTSPNDIRPKEQSQPLGHGTADVSSMTQQQVCQLIDKKMTLVCQEKAVFKEEPVEILLPPKRVAVVARQDKHVFKEEPIETLPPAKSVGVRARQDKHVFKEEPVETLLLANKVETSTSVKKATNFTTSPSTAVQPVICSEGSLDKNLGVQESDVPNTLPKFD